MDQVLDTTQDSAATRINVGSVLREAREQLGMSVADVAGRLKFAPRQISALEAGDFEHLPEMAFVRGFVRSYARLLQLDDAALLEALPSSPAQALLPEKKSVEEPFPNVYAIRKSNILWLAAALLVALVIGMLAWKHDGGQTASKQVTEIKPAKENTPEVEVANNASVVAESAVAEVAPATRAGAEIVVAPPVVAPVVAPKAAATPAVNPVRKHTGHSMLRLVFDEDSWFEVKDGDGKVLLSRVGPQGSEQTISNGILPLSVAIGNAKGVRLYFKENLVDLVPYTNVHVAHLTLE